MLSGLHLFLFYIPSKSCAPAGMSCSRSLSCFENRQALIGWGTIGVTSRKTVTWYGQSIAIFQAGDTYRTRLSIDLGVVWLFLASTSEHVGPTAPNGHCVVLTSFSQRMWLLQRQTILGQGLYESRRYGRTKLGLMRPEFRGLQSRVIVLNDK